jgi:hypothetical protein
MGKAIGVLASLGLLVLVAVHAGLASAGQSSGIRGVVLDSSCAGPCIVGEEPQPYPGSDLRVVIRRLPGQDVARRLSPKGGRFSTRLRPGLYRVNAYVNASCWQGEAERVRVGRRFSSVILHVQNSCLLCPAVPGCLPCPPCPPCPPYAEAALICPPCPLPTALSICEPCPPGQVCIL